MREAAPYWGLRLWALQFGGALYALAVACRIFGVPLGEVVDVMLPLQLLLPAITAAKFCVLCAVNEEFAQQSRPILSLFSYVLSPFAASTGYGVLAALYELGPPKQSSFYAMLADALNTEFLTVVSYARRFHVPYADTFSPAGYPLLPQAVLASISLVFAVVSATAALKRNMKIDS